MTPLREKDVLSYCGVPSSCLLPGPISYPHLVRRKEGKHHAGSTTRCLPKQLVPHLLVAGRENTQFPPLTSPWPGCPAHPGLESGEHPVVALNYFCSTLWLRKCGANMASEAHSSLSALGRSCELRASAGTSRKKACITHLPSAGKIKCAIHRCQITM